MGKTIGELLQNPYPWPWQAEHCQRDACPPCSTKVGKCKTRNLVYRIDCLTCKFKGIKAVNVGETHRNFHDRSSEYMKNLEAKKDSSALYKHWQNKHQDLHEPPEYAHTVVKTFKTSTERQVYEAVTIDSIECNMILNSKAEYRHNALVRQTIEFRGEIWTPEELSLAENYCQNERNSPSPQSQGTSNFNEQFKQRKGQRKAKTDTQTDVIQPQNRSDFSNDTPRTIQNLSQKSHNHDQKEPFQDGVEPKIHQRVQVFAQGRHVRSLRDVKIKRIKLIVIWTQYHTIQITSNTKVKSRNRNST